MYLLHLLALLIVSSSSLGDFSLGEIYKNEGNNNSFTVNPEVLASETTSKDYQERTEGVESNTTVFPNHFEERELNDSIPLNDTTVRKIPLDEQFRVQHYDPEGDYHNEESKLNQSLIRRQINNWEASDEFFDPYRNLETYPKPDFSHIHNEYVDENYPFDPSQRNDTLLEELEGSFQVEPPQYYQKNYYYNYYPLVRSRFDQGKIAGPKMQGSEEEVLNSEATGANEKFIERKTPKKNPCKLYLQFLKYAFKELDRNSDYDDLDEEYIDWEADGSQRMFSTQLLGPTLFVDNSGRVYQVNSNGNSIQTVERIPPSSKLLSSEKDLLKAKVTTQIPSNELRTDPSMSQNLPDSYLNPYDHLSSEITDSNDSVSMNDKNSNSLTTEGKHKKERTYPTTLPTEIERTTTYTEPTLFLTTTSTPKFSHEEVPEYFRRSGQDSERPSPNRNHSKSYSAAGSPLFFHKHPNLTIPSNMGGKNHFRSDSVITFGNSHNHGSKDPDCNDKTLPCPDTFNVTYPLNGYCNRYVSCESGVAIRRTCPNGFHFNVITKSCDFPHNSICSYYCPEPNGKFGIPGDCSGYFICENSIPEYRMCPPRMHWDVKISSCTFAALSSCPMKCSGLSEIKPYKGDCKAYVICLNGIPYYHKCPPNFVYNSENQTCVPQHHINCRNDPKLLTKTANPSTLCKNVDQKLGTKAWCSYYFPPENSGSEEKFSRG